MGRTKPETRMLIAITGHADGIGKDLSSVFSRNGHTVIGLDIKKGDDIRDLSIVDKIKSADIFINNAFTFEDTGAQKRLFEAMYSEWKYENKHIINMNSLSRFYEPNELQFPEYTQAKRDLNQVFTRAVASHDRKVILSQVSPGYTDTNLTANISMPKMEVKTVSDAVMMCVYYSSIGIEITELTLKKI